MRKFNIDIDFWKLFSESGIDLDISYYYNNKNWAKLYDILVIKYPIIYVKQNHFVWMMDLIIHSNSYHPSWSEINGHTLQYCNSRLNKITSFIKTDINSNYNFYIFKRDIQK